MKYLLALACLLTLIQTLQAAPAPDNSIFHVVPPEISIRPTINPRPPPVNAPYPPCDGC
ncbi:hypothetical protein PGT21_014233 [Puccinia graminis f. sp. tritici]|uniref:Uncharacterized protein n=1 Tax=Puccinia graminis f. sp. tritici TaxID=56615 RepID=A0A5B0MER8_PUCGR|nr:hypothetical protein PGT21_013277 [Puccinia graminis f. sp. tritici]KAA1080603.1 hypothetical protein PGT21_014233 [Puccinia graminis f. sp. tritici]KAA1115960.1 hypothetical protein PGTUg99_026264 [Puccinia graminis f. sp. tritici]KAA1131560.1 hypothetical protein PGTUg99_030863 [Puccinia graminis f. sp. tritici]